MSPQLSPVPPAPWLCSGSAALFPSLPPASLSFGLWLLASASAPNGALVFPGWDSPALSLRRPLCLAPMPPFCLVRSVPWPPPLLHLRCRHLYWCEGCGLAQPPAQLSSLWGTRGFGDSLPKSSAWQGGGGGCWSFGDRARWQVGKVLVPSVREGRRAEPRAPGHLGAEGSRLSPDAGRRGECCGEE